MSLPTAPKDISTHPTQGSVVAPVDRHQKDADVDRKLRLYGVIQAFRQGRMPTNQQIDETLAYVVEHSPVDLQKLSPEGRKLVQDLREIISTTRLMVQSKNHDEVFQQFMWNTRFVDTDRLKSSNLEDHLPVSPDGVKTDADEARRHIRTLVTLFFTNSEVRKLLNDFSLIGRDLLAKGAVKAAQTVGPPEEQLRNVDQTAPPDQFISEGGRPVGPGEKPILEQQIPGTGRTFRQDPDHEARIRHPGGQEQTLGSAYNETYQQKEQLKAEGFQQAGQFAQQAPYEAQSHAQDVLDADDPEGVANEKKTGIKGRYEQLKQSMKDAVPQQHRDKANDQFERGRKFFSEEYFPEERRDQFIFRGKKVIMECQKHEDYQTSMRWLLDTLRQYAKHSRFTVESGEDKITEITSQHSLNVAISQLRTLLERFANGTSLDLIFDAANALIDDARRDDDLRGWFSSVDTYIRKVLLEPGYVLEPDCNNQAKRLRDSGRFFYDDKYRGHFDNFFNSVRSWFSAFNEDPVNRQFGEDWARLTRDLLFDSEGALKFKPNLWNDLRRVIFPQLISQIGYIPIPRIEYSDDSMDLVVENLTLEGRNLFPNIIAMDAHNHMKFSPYDAIKDDSHHKFTIHLEQMQADMRDVAFYYRKKTGIPKMKDSGIADVLLGGEGLSAVIHLASAGKDHTSVFKVQEIIVKVGTLKFSIRDSKHDFLYKTLRPLATGLIKKQIQRAFSDALRTGLEYLDGQLVGVRDRMNEAKMTEGQTRTEVLKDIFQHKKDEASIKSTDSKSQFKIVSDKRNSILADAGHPAGWVNRTAEHDQKATAGKEWRSEAFHII